MPLLVGLDGVEKMSKSKNNAVGIDEEPTEIFGKLMSISDEMMPSYFELCTDVPIAEIKVLTDAAVTHPKEAKKRLAREVIALYHGDEAAEKADADFESKFGHGKSQNSVEDLPEVQIPASDGPEGKIRAAAFLVKAGLTPSSGEAKRLIQQGGLSLDGAKISDPGQELELKPGQVVKVGKHRFVRLA
jgi:tyrosyl-tRNA synthetase